MAPPGKFRSKRASSSSSSSYSSTLTTVGFIALCVFGVWMLTSDSMVPPDTSSAVIVEDPATARLVDKVADQESKSAQQDLTINQNEPKPEAQPQPQPQPETATETRADDPHKGETDDAPKEEIHQPENQNQNQDQPNQNTQKEDPVEQNNQNLDVPDQKKPNEDQVTQTQEQSQQNQEQINPEEHKSPHEDQNEQATQEEHKSRNEDQSEQQQVKQEDQSQDQNEESNRNEDRPEQKSQDEKTNSNSSVEPEQEQEQQKEQDQKQETEAEPQQPEEDKANAKQKAEAEKAHEDEEKQQGERQNMLSTGGDQQKSAQQHQQNSDHKLGGHEFSDQTNNPDSKTDPDESDNSNSNSKSHQQQQQPDNQDQNKNSDGEAKQTEESNSFPVGDNSGIPKESKDSKSWSTQAVQSENQNERHASNDKEGLYGYTWQLCNETVGPDFIPCLDNEKVLKRLRTTRHFQHRERHCPEDPPTCLVPLPDGYKSSITWPRSRDKIWYHNVPHTSLVDFKGHQNWVKLSGEFLKFPGGGTQFIHGAHYYIDFLQQVVPDISWGKHIRVTLDVGCGVASFGGYLFDKDVLTMSFAPKDEHEAQVQFALERGIPAISAVMGTQRLPFPSRVFDLVHCARCRVPWHEEGGRLLMELNRVLRPGGFFVWSATPVYEKNEEDLQIWKEMSALTISMCFELVTIKKNKINKIAAAIYRKPTTNECYEQRKHKSPPMCKDDDDANAAWYVPLQTCMHRVPVDPNERGTQWPEEWPARLQEPPYWLNSSQMGIYGKPAPEDFSRDYVHWKRVVERSYMKGLGIDWSNVRNVMDMRAVYGGFAAALKDVKVWVLNVVNTDSPDTLPIIYERGLFGIYHDWCESFSSYPRTYDLLHADHLFSRVKKRCKIPPLMAEIDRLVRPGGKLIVRDEADVIGEVESLLRSLRWEVRLIFSKNQAGLLSAQKTDWRPDTYVSSSSSI